MTCYKTLIVTLLAAVTLPSAAGLLDDDEARKAILELRSEVRQRDAEHGDSIRRLNDTSAQQSDTLSRLGAATAEGLSKLRKDHSDQIELLRRNVLDLNDALAASREDNARLRGQLEVLQNGQSQSLNAAQTQQQVAQKKQQEFEAAIDARLKKLEPRTVAVDGKEAMVERAEEASFNTALNHFKAADYKSATRTFESFVAQYPQSGLQATALFWLGNSQYAAKDPMAALTTLQGMMQKFPQHARAADAYLTIGRSYEDLNDKKRSADMYNYVIQTYPNTPQAQAAQESLPKKPVPKKKV